MELFCDRYHASLPDLRCDPLHITGEWCQGKTDAKTPDVMDQQTMRLYDSTVDNCSNPQLWVTCKLTPSPAPIDWRGWLDWRPFGWSERELSGCRARHV